MKELFDDQWKEFVKKIPYKESHPQVEEIRRGFYAGGRALARILRMIFGHLELETPPDDLSNNTKGV